MRNDVLLEEFIYCNRLSLINKIRDEHLGIYDV